MRSLSLLPHFICSQRSRLVRDAHAAIQISSRGVQNLNRTRKAEQYAENLPCRELQTQLISDDFVVGCIMIMFLMLSSAAS